MMAKQRSPSVYQRNAFAPGLLAAALTALKHGKHVLLEKPPGASVAEVMVLDRLARDGRFSGTLHLIFQPAEERLPGGSLSVGSPDTVARKIASTVQALGLSRFDLKYSHGTLGHPELMRSIELYGTQVIPRVRELLAD